MSRIKKFGEEEPEHTKLNRLGKIKVGEKTEPANGQKSYPKALDYFVATGKYADKFRDVYGEKPTEIGVVFVTDNLSDACNERFELRDNKGALIGSGDGVTFKLWNKELTKYEPFEIKKEEDKKVLQSFANKFKTANYEAKWYSVLTLQFVIPKIKDVFGVWVFETRGVMSSIPNIRDTFDNIQRFAGTVVNIPFDLIVQKVKSQKPGDTRTYPVVNLIPNISTDKMDDVKSFLQSGNSIYEVKKLLESSTNKQLPDAKLQLEQSKAKENAKGELVENKLF